VLSQGSHDFLQPLVYAFAGLALLPLVALALFSRRFGRLGSPGAAVLAGIAPAALLATLARGAAGSAGDRPDDLPGRLGEAVTPALDDLSTAFLLVAAAAAVAVTLAVVAHTGAWLFARPREAWEEQPAAVAQQDDEPASVAPLQSMVRPATYVSDQGFAGYDPAAKGSLGPGSLPQT
jgi:hypothetical protein